MKYLKIYVDAANQDAVYTEDGRRGQTITTLDIDTTQSLFGTKTHYPNIMESVPISHEFSSLRFTITSNIDWPVDVDATLNMQITLKIKMWNKIWNIDGTVQKLKTSSFKFSTNFPVYVNDEKYFNAELPEFEITNDQSKFFTLDNSYFIACCAAYCATYLCGISTEHFMEKDPLISTLAKYHFYYLMTKFLRSPDKLNTHMTDEHYALVRKHIPVKYIWKSEFDQTKERIDIWFNKHRRGTVKDYWVSMSKNPAGGQIGIHYMKRMGQTFQFVRLRTICSSEK